MDSVDYRPSSDLANISMKAGALALEAVEAGVKPELVYRAIQMLITLYGKD